MVWIIGVVAAWIAAGLLGGWVATQKGRRAAEGLALGVLFGPFGVIVEALLPNVAPEPEPPRSTGGLRAAQPSPPFSLDQLRLGPEPPAPDLLPPIPAQDPTPFDDIKMD
jgi:hypothetical protein